MKNMSFLIGIFTTMALLSGCAGMDSGTVSIETIVADSIDMNWSMYGEDMSSNLALQYEIEDILRHGTEEITDKSIIRTVNADIPSVDELTYSFYGSKDVAIPFCMEDILSTVKEECRAYYYVGADGKTYACLYPTNLDEEKIPTNIVFRLDTDKTEDLQGESVEAIFLSGVSTLREDEIQINNLPLGEKALSSIEYIFKGGCNGFSAKCYNETGKLGDYRIIRLDNDVDLVSLDINVYITEEHSFVESITIQK